MATHTSIVKLITNYPQHGAPPRTNLRTYLRRNRS